MATLHVRQFPDSLHHLLEKRAEHDHRSLSAEVIVLLERDLKKPRTDWKESFRQMHERREDQLLLNDSLDVDLDSWKW